MKMALLCFVLIQTALASTEWTKNLKLHPSIKLHKFIEVKGARQMTQGPDGTLYVGSMQEGNVYSVDKMGKITVIFKDLELPQGVLWENGELYVAEMNKISKTKDLKKLTLIKEFPGGKWHGWKTIQKGPDGKLYIPEGAPCNVCDRELPFMAINRMDFDGKNFETVARGIRNTVGYTWHPETKEIWFTEMGRDLMGDDVPPEEINVIKKTGAHFGFPYLHGSKIEDPTWFKKKPKDLEITLPIYEMQAHSAPIGIAFFPKDKWPKDFHDCFLLAEHGSWNRSKKVGYQVMKGCVKDGKVASYEPFITGFKDGEKVFGRPVHFLFLEDGSFFLSEDEPGTLLHFTQKK